MMRVFFVGRLSICIQFFIQTQRERVHFENSSQKTEWSEQDEVNDGEEYSSIDRS